MRSALALALIAAAATTTAADARPSPDRKLEFTDTAMGTVVNVFLWTDDGAAAQRAADEVFAEMRRIDRLMTTWNDEPASEVIKINKAAGDKPVQVSDETYAVIARAVEVSRRTNGVFDITVGAFKGLWKFDEDMDYTLPEPAEVRQRLANIGWRHLRLDPKARTVFLDKKGMSITLGGIAKGYAVDKCAALLQRAGYVSFMIQAGGDMYVAGKKDTAPWQVGIRDPRGPDGAMFALAPIEDHSFSTSGDYERGFVNPNDGLRYHHILDPRTGFPARASRSVTVRAKDAFTADAWSKVMFILGWKQAMKLIEREKLRDFEVVWVDDQNTVHMTKDIEKVIRIMKPPTPGP
jgi:thiamine biosynthesis lipoprotein